MTSRNKDTDKELPLVEKSRLTFSGQDADVGYNVGTNRPELGQNQNLLSVDSRVECSCMAGQTAFENFQIKKEMAIALVEMGISKKDVIEILNITIE
jgi:hypothetical protein